MGKGKVTAAPRRETASGGTAVVEGATEVNQKFGEVNQKLEKLDTELGGPKKTLVDQGEKLKQDTRTLCCTITKPVFVFCEEMIGGQGGAAGGLPASAAGPLFWLWRRRGPLHSRR
jgi:hypothetical protein